MPMISPQDEPTLETLEQALVLATKKLDAATDALNKRLAASEKGDTERDLRAAIANT